MYHSYVYFEQGTDFPHICRQGFVGQDERRCCHLHDFHQYCSMTPAIQLRPSPAPVHRTSTCRLVPVVMFLTVKTGQGIQNKAHYEHSTVGKRKAGRPNRRWTGQQPPKWGTSENSLHTAAAAAVDDDDDDDEGTIMFERLAILLLINGTRFKLAIIVRRSSWFSTILHGKCVETGHNRFLPHSSWFNIHDSLSINPTGVLDGLIYIYI